MEWQGEFLQDHCFAGCVFSGVPGDLEIQQALQDTEEKLKLNALCVEQSLKELQVELSGVWSGERGPGTADWRSPWSLSSLRPTCTGRQALLDFLRALVTSHRAVQSSPLSSLHAVREEACLDVQSAWDDVRLQLRRPLLDRLSGRAVFLSCPESSRSLEGHERVRVEGEVFFLRPLFLNLETKERLKRQIMLCVLTAYLNSLVTAVEQIGSVSAGKTRMLYFLSPVQTGQLRPDSVAKRPTLFFIFKRIRVLSPLDTLRASLMSVHCSTAWDEGARPSDIHTSVFVLPSVCTAMLPEQPRKGRNICLTSHQLRLLAQLTETLLCIEKRTEELTADISPLNCAGEAPGSERDMRKTSEELDTAAAEGSKPHCDQLLQASEPAGLRFDWRSALKELAAPVAHGVKVVLEELCSHSLQQEEDLTLTRAVTLNLSLNKTVTLVNEKNRHFEKPIFILIWASAFMRQNAKFCADVMQELDALLPLALACREGFQLEIRAAFVDACSKAAAALLARLGERSREVPRTAPTRNLHTSLSTAVYVLQRLAQYETLLKDSARQCSNVPVFLLTLQQYRELVGALQVQLTGHCVRTCATSILQDAESHFWCDPKPFYEGERCSFSIQMWHYFLSALRWDLWNVLPPSLAQDVLAQVLTQTLEILVQRYSQACPTYSRTLQIRADITAVLLCAESLLWGLCSSPGKLLWPDRDPCPRLFSIHSLCNQLLAVLAVVTSPLRALFETFRRGPEDLSSLSAAGPSGCPPLQWLRFVKPSLFSRQEILAADEISSQLQLKLMLSQPSCNPRLLLQTLLQSDCLLLRVLLNTYFSSRGDDLDSTDCLNDAEMFLEAVFMVLSSLNDVPRSLATVLESYFDKMHLWERLHNLSDASKAEPRVLKCLRAAVSKPVLDAVQHLVSMVNAWQDAEHHGTHPHKHMVPESLLNKIPREWAYTPREIKRKQTGKSFTQLVAQAVCFVFTNLPSLVASLPAPVRYLFCVAESRLARGDRQPRPAGLLVCSCVATLCHTLEDGDALERLTEAALDRWGKEKLGLLSECLQGVLGQQRGAPKPAVQKVLQHLEAQRPRWLEIQLQKARRLSTEAAFEPAESIVVRQKGSAPELTEQKIGMMVLDICHKPGGSEYLRQIYHIIQLNEELLSFQLTAAADTPQRPLTLNLTAADRLHLSSVFNPLKEFSHIGSNKFDQSAMTERDWDWPKLLPSYLGLSQVTLRALLANSMTSMVSQKAALVYENSHRSSA
uniref:KIAA0825 n=1 Tax=Lepisosteus oculatus TaxID=7918 RepID=W5M0F4_LEPOC